MAGIIKKPLIPIFLLIVLTGLYFTRWNNEISFKPNQAIQSVYKTDRWTGQRWVIQYLGNRVNEMPIIDEYLVALYAESVKTRPDIKGKAEFEAVKPQGFAKIYNTPKEIIYENALSRISIEAARTELGNQAWAKRKHAVYVWWAFVGVVMIWLFASVVIKIRKTN